MANVDFASKVPQVSPTRLPGVSVSAKAFGADVGAAMQEMGATGVQVADEFAERGAVTDAKKADTELAKKLEILGFGDGTDENRGHFATEGEDAVGGEKAVRDEADKEYQRLLEGLSDRARRKYEAAASSRMETFSKQLNKHTLTGRKTAETGASIAREEQAYRDAASMAGTDENGKWTTESGKHIALAKQEAMARAKRAGLGTDVIINEGEKAVSKGHVAVIDALKARKDYAGALEYLEKNKAALGGTATAKLRGSLAAPAQLKATQDWTDDVRAQYMVDSDEEALYAAARKEKNQDLRKAKVAAAKVIIAEGKAQAVSDAKDLRLSAIKKINDPSGEALTDAETEAMLAVPGGASLIHTGRAKAKAQREGRGGQPDVNEEARLNKLSPEDLAGVDLTTPEMVRKLGKNHGKWVKKQGDIMEDMRQGVDMGRTPAQVRADTVRGWKNAQKVQAFGARFDDEIQALTEGKPKGYRVPSSELAKIADRITLKLRKEVDWGIDEKVFAFELPAGRERTTPIEDTKKNYDNISRLYNVPEDVVPDLLAAMKSKGIPWTLPNIARAIEQARKAPK